MHSSTEVRLTAVKTIDYVAQKVPTAVKPNVLAHLIPDLIACCKDRNTAIKSTTELAMISLLSLRDGDQKLEVRSVVLHFLSYIAGFVEWQSEFLPRL